MPRLGFFLRTLSPALRCSGPAQADYFTTINLVCEDFPIAIVRRAAKLVVVEGALVDCAPKHGTAVYRTAPHRAALHRTPPHSGEHLHHRAPRRHITASATTSPQAPLPQPCTALLSRRRNLSCTAATAATAPGISRPPRSVRPTPTGEHSLPPSLLNTHPFVPSYRCPGLPSPIC